MMTFAYWCDASFYASRTLAGFIFSAIKLERVLVVAQLGVFTVDDLGGSSIGVTRASDSRILLPPSWC